MKLKRFAAALLAFCLMLTLLPAGVSAASGAGWTLDEDSGVLTVDMENIYGSTPPWKEEEDALAVVTVKIGPSVKTAAGLSFSACKNLEAFTVDEDNTVFCAEGGVLYTADMKTIVCYPPARVGTKAEPYPGKTGVYVVPETVEKVDLNAFLGLTESGNELEIYASAETRASVASYAGERRGSDFPEDMINNYVPVTGVNTEKFMSLEIGETKRLRAAVLTKDAAEPATFGDVSWTSGDDGIATVAENGGVWEVTGHKAGKVTVTVTTADKGYTDTCTVTVEKKDVNRLSLSEDILTLDSRDGAEKHTDTLTATLKPADATNRYIAFLSTDPNVAVPEPIEDGKGEIDGGTGAVIVEAEEPVTAGADEEEPSASASVRIRATGIGEASIVAVTQDGGHYAVSRVIVPWVTLNKGETALTFGQTETLRATLRPGNAEVTNVEWSVSPAEGVVTVAESEENDMVATVTPVSVGEATVTFTAVTGGVETSEECTVTVGPAPVTRVTLEPYELALDLKDKKTARLAAAVEREGPDRAEVTWDVGNISGDGSDDDGDVVGLNVASDGLSAELTAVAPGSAVITVTAGGHKAMCAVTVAPTKVESVALKTASGGEPQEELELTLPLTGTKELTAVLTPADPTERGIVWLSTDDGIVSVSSPDGETVTLTPRAPGKATVYAITRDGAEKAICKVTVPEKISSFTLEPSALALAPGKSRQLTATVEPSGAVDGAVSWTSSATAVARVEQDGLVTAVAPGVAVISAAIDGGRYTASCVVTVSLAKVTGLRFDQTALTLDKDVSEKASATLTAWLKPGDATNRYITFLSTNRSVADVTAPGGTLTDAGALIVQAAEGAEETGAPVTVEAKGYGTAVIIAATADGAFMAQCTVTVERPPAQVQSVTIHKNSLTMTAGDTDRLAVTVLPAEADQTVTWSISPEGVATVDQTGFVKAVSGGEATITVTAAGGKSATCDVKVTDQAVLVENVSLQKALTLSTGRKETLIAEVTPANADDRSVEWITTDPNVAVVNNSGAFEAEVEAKGPGTATILVKAKSGGRTDYCVVTVEASVTALTLNRSAVTIGMDQTELLVATVEPYDAKDRTVTYTMDRNDVIRLDGTGNSWIVTPLSVGTATVTFTAGGKSAECAVTVSPAAVKSATLSNQYLRLYVGDTHKLSVTVSPNVDVSFDTPTWESADQTVATVSADGTVTAFKVGTTQITATVTDSKTGSTYPASCTVEVIPAPAIPVSSITLDPVVLSLAKGSSQTLTPTVLPNNATERGVTWHSCDEAVAKVDSQGNVTAVSAGTAVIVAATKDGGLPARCTVTVTSNEATGLILNRTALSLVSNSSKEGEKTFILTAAPVPAGASASVRWRSLDTTVATVDNDGKVTAVSPGTATIEAYVPGEDGTAVCTAACVVTVREAVTKISLRPTELTMYMGVDDRELTATLEPNVEGASVTWHSSNENVATVTGSGTGAIVKAVGGGKAAIIAVTEEGGLAAACVVTVWKKPTELTLRESLILAVGDVWPLTATVGDGEDPEVEWSSSAEGIAEVKDGVVTAKAAGTADVTARSVSGGVSRTCRVTVREYTVSNAIGVPSMTISEEAGGERTVELTSAAGDEIWYYTDKNPTSHENYNGTPITVRENTTIMAYAVRESYQSAVITGVITVTGGARSIALTDRMGNSVNTLAEAAAGGSVTANVTLSAEAAKTASDIYLAVYDIEGALISLTRYEVELDGTGGQVLMQPLDLSAAMGAQVGSVRLMVLSAGKAPVTSAGTLSG